MKQLVLKSFVFLAFALITNVSFAQKRKKVLPPLDTASLQMVFDSSTIIEKTTSIDEDYTRMARHARIQLINYPTKLRGKLIAYNKYGLFLYQTKMRRLGFYPFKYIEKVKLGRSYGHLVVVVSSIGGVIGGLTFAMEFNPIIFPVGVIYGGGLAAYLQLYLSPLHGYYKYKNNLNWNLMYKKTSPVAFYNFIKSNPDKIEYVQEYKIEFKVSQKVNESFEDAKNSERLKEREITKTVETEKTSDTEKLKPNLGVESRKFLEGQSFGDDNHVKVKWIYIDFNSNKLNESDIQTKFKNIRGMQLDRGQLSKYNTSQLQFLAMMICSGGGFNMKDAIQLTENQRKILGFYEAGFLEEVKLDGSLSTMNLSDIDLENLKVIFAELGDR